MGMASLDIGRHAKKTKTQIKVKVKNVNVNVDPHGPTGTI